jgi:hypothetical protein
MNKRVKPLYRKVNTKARNCYHLFGSDAKHDRNTKGGLKKSMSKGVERGLDYTPLYMFLLSKVGKNWDEVYSEAVSRLKFSDPIFYIVKSKDSKPYVLCGESSYYSTLYVDEDNILRKVDPNMTNEKITPSCPCCTHTFNGKPLILPYSTHTSRL